MREERGVNVESKSFGESGSFEIGALLFGDGAAEFFEDFEHILPDEGFGGKAIRTKKIGWVKGGHDGNAAEGHEFAANFTDRRAFAEEAGDGGGAKGDDGLGLDQVDLRV